MSPRDKQEWLAEWLKVGGELLEKAKAHGLNPKDYRPQDLFEHVLGLEYLEEARHGNPARNR